MHEIINFFILFSLLVNYDFCKSFIFSVIISIYNAGRYLHEAIDSVLNQTIGNKKIEILLINDGSIDNTDKICLAYKEKYKKNILYIKINHGGVSKARNIGIKYSRGEFVNFLDADDKWDIKAFNYVSLFFRFYKKINIIGCRLIFFEAKVNSHPLDYKFLKSRVVNLSDEYNFIHLSSSSSFFRYKLIKNRRFKEGIFNGEDTRFINSILLINPLLGILKEAIYYYRKRSDSTSVVQNSYTKQDYYFSILKSVDEFLIEKSKKLYNKVLPFIQFYLAYNILYRISFPTFKYLDKNQITIYYQNIKKILSQIEEKYIIEQKHSFLKEKFVALSKKYNRDLRDEIIIQNNSFIYSGKRIVNLKNFKNILVWVILEFKKNIIHLEGKDNCFLREEQFFYFCKIDNKIIFPKYYDYSGYDFITMYGRLNKGRLIIFNIPLKIKKYQLIQFFISYMGKNIEIFPSMGWFTPISSLINGYYNSGKYILKYIEDRLCIYKYDQQLKELFEKKYIQILKKKKKNNIIILRNNYFKYKKKIINKKIENWIINDKQNLAGDSGEYFFRFLKAKNPKGINYFFVIKKNCSDYNRLKHLGNILEFGSEKYLNKFLISDKIISSVCETWVDNPFKKDRKYLKDLFNFKYIFIQHGIIKDDLTKFLNKIIKNFQIIVTSSNKEYKSILKYKYHYDINNAILTGFPRYDNIKKLHMLYNKQKIILIIPSWRNYIKGVFDSYYYKSIYSYSFRETDYFKFYNNLINDEKLLINLKAYNYTGIFCLHPHFSKQLKDFKKNIIFSIPEICDYQNLIAKSSLLVTDYSSIFFDFGYLKKPIIYFHFDYKNYTTNNYQRGFFDYKKYGFGPICYDINCTINKVISNIKKNCEIQKKYLNRIYKYFKYIDEKNSERLYIGLINNAKNKNRDIFSMNIILMIILFITLKMKYRKNSF